MNLIFASSNQNKAREIEKLLPPSFSVKTLKDIGFTEDIPETEATIKGNALLKARFINRLYAANCFADDSGLEVEALNGAPGVFSARYAGEPSNDKLNIEKLLHALDGKENRKARFVTVIALIIDGKEYIFEGIVNGEITQSEKGDKGFGYDPVFKPDNFDVTFAEMELTQKNKISHRALAVAKMVLFLKEKEND
jgi:XTP/dITP diphosphohydrolase